MSYSSRPMNPFPGLRPFTQEEDYLFFGREEQTLELLARLGSHRFVAVVGTSGSGKSSLVRCGLLSELLGGKMRGAGADWEIAVTHPGGNPLALLTEALLDAGLYDRAQENTRENLLATLSRSHFGLVEAVKQAGLGAGTNFLLVVDQFEEIFRFHEAGQTQQEMANEFVSLLLQAAAQKETPIYVVLTMRSDFIGECGEFEGLAEAVNRGEFLIPRLTREQYKRVIEGPIQVAGGKITPRLLQRLLNDLGQQADQLPCLQHALMRTWNFWAEQGDQDALDLDDYQRVGKMTHALSLHADEIYEARPTDRERQLCRGLFQALTVEESENRGIRRPQRLGRLCQILDVSAAELLPIIDAYRRHGVTFLMPAPEVELTERTIIDISHESLMRVWTRLRNWVEEEAQAAGIYLRLSESAALYRQGKAALYRDPELGIALAWQQSQRPNAAWAERYTPGFDTAMAFLAKSQEASVAEEEAREAARQRELEQARQLAEAQRLRLEQQQRSARRLRQMIGGLAAVAVIAVVACALALVANQRANTLADQARQNEERALHNEKQANENALRAEESEQKTANALATVAAQKTEVEDSLSGSLEYFSAALKQADGYEARKPIVTLLARFDMVLGAFVERQPGDQQLQLALARRLTERGQNYLAKTQPAKAQDELEKSRTIFTRLVTPNNTWQVLTPIEMKTESGAKMEMQKDGSIFVHQDQGGKNDTYTLVFHTDLKGVTGLRLDVLADSRLPKGGPGWMGGNGNFYLSELTLEAARADSPGNARAIALRNAWADYSDRGADVRGAIDGNDRTAWAVWPEINKDHTAVFELAEKVGDGAAARLTVRLIHKITPEGNLGRFRLSFTDDPRTLQFPQIRQDVKDGELVDCNIALAKAYAQQGQTKKAIGSYTDALLLASDRAGKGKVITEAAPVEGALATLTDRAAGEGKFQAELAQHFAAQGHAPLANPARAKARTWFEEKLAKEPESSALAAELTQVLLDQQEQENARWTVLKPTEMKSEGGATLTLQPDGSVLASGPNPNRDLYSLVARTGLKQITAIRLEALPDPSLPLNGPGRFPGNGNFHLNKLRVFSGGALVPLTRIVVAHSENADYPNLIDGRIDANVGWSNFPRAGVANTAVVVTSLQRAADDALKIELYCSRGPYTQQHNLGRFRLSVSGDPAALEHESAAMKVTDPWLRLAAAYATSGCNEEASHYFSKALQQARGFEAKKPIIEVAARFEQVLATLIKRQPDDPQLHLALARQHAERGKELLAQTQPAKAQAELETSRTIITGLLAKYREPHWTVLQPTEKNSKGGATLSLLEDGSILASGNNPARDDYTVLARPSLERITAIRLEALPDPSLPGNGPGRTPAGPNAGNFHLNKVRAFSAGQPCPLTDIIVDHANMMGNNTATPFQQVIHGEVDNSPGWGNWPRAGKSNTAVIATHVARAPNDDLKIEMVFSRSGWTQHNLGRFRLAVTNDADAIKAIELRKDFKDSEVADLNVALAKAHAQQGRTTEAVALLTEALDRTADPAGKASIIAEAAPLQGVLEKLAERAPDDGPLQAELARHLAAQGHAPLANAARAKARAWLEEKLAKEPENPEWATALAHVLLDHLSVSGDPASADEEQKRAAAMTLTDPWARLAAAYWLVGDQAILERLLKHHPAAVGGIGDLHVAVGRTRDGVPHLAKTFAADPSDTLLGVKVAALEAWFGQEKEYAATRQRILGVAKGTNDWMMADRTAKACSLRVSADKAEREAVLALSRTGAQLEKNEWTLLALGMAEYRSENYAAADKALAAAAQAGPNNLVVTGIAPFYRAMCLFRQGKFDEAHKLATVAAAKMKPLPADEQNPLAGDADHDDLILWLAYKEAKDLLKFDAAPAAHWLTRALAHHRLGETEQAKQAARKAADMLKLAPAGTAGIVATPIAPVPGVPAAKGRAMMQISQNLNVNDPANCPGRPAGCYYKLQPVKLKAGRTYIIEMDQVGQSGLDPYLVLVNRAGQVVAQDDDSGGNQNARIVYKAQETGMFRVYATSFIAGMTGGFRLTVSQEAGAAHAAVSPENAALRALLHQTVLALGTDSPEARELIAAAAGEPPATLNEAVRQNPGQASGYRVRGNWHAERARWNDAIADYAEVFRLDPNTLDAMKLGILLASSGETERFHQHTRAMLSRWASTEKNSEADQTLKTIVLIPDSKGDAKQLARLAEAAVAGDVTREWYEWWQVAKALHDVRTGRYADALTACRASRQRAPESKGAPEVLTALDLAIEAMALHGAGQADEARRMLEQAKPLIESHVPGIDGGDWWAEWLAAHMLYREAVGLILTQKAEPKN